MASMTEPVTPGWNLVCVVAEGDAVSVDGLDPWSHPWISEGHQITVAHPTFPSQRHQVAAWTINREHRRVLFAAGELSAGAWAFFVPARGRGTGQSW